MRNHDLVFLKHFSLAIVFLVVVTVFLIIGAIVLHDRRVIGDDTGQRAKIEARIQAPVGVYAGETGAAALAAAAEAAAQAAAGQVAYDGTLDGAVIYNALCGACHTSGAGGAPTMEKSAWTARIAQGEETMIRHAIEGFQGAAGLMPARGGNPALNDEQVAASVRWMVENLK